MLGFGLQQVIRRSAGIAGVRAYGLCRPGRADRRIHQATEYVAFTLIASTQEAGAADDDLVFGSVREFDLYGAFCRLVLIEDEVGIVAAKAEIANCGAAGRFAGCPVGRSGERMKGG